LKLNVYEPADSFITGNAVFGKGLQASVVGRVGCEKIAKALPLPPPPLVCPESGFRISRERSWIAVESR